MKVCFVIQKLAGLTGGAERILCEVASAMAARGMTVTVLTYDSRAGDPAYPLDGVTQHNLFPAPRATSKGTAKPRRLEGAVKTIPNIWPLPQIKWALTYAPFITRLNRAFAQIQPDVVVGFMPTGIMAAAEAAHPLGIPVIASTHNLPEQDFGDGGRWDANPVYRKRRLAALHKTNHILVLQQAFADWFGTALADRISVMPNPVAPATMPLEDARKKLVLGVGRLTPIKRYDLLIAGFAQISPRHPDWRLAIYGDGPERAALAAQITTLGMDDKITLAGTTPQIMDVYANAAILCHPASFEGFGLSVAEALAHGLPVIADATCPGVNTLVKHEKTGLLIDAQHDTAAALERLIGNPDLRGAMAKAAPASMERFAPDTIFTQWETLLRSCQSNPDLV